MSLSKPQRRLRAQVAAFTLHARGGTNTAPARERFLARFEDEVDPDRKLPEEERLRRARLARKAYMARLALKSSRNRADRTSTPKPGG